MQLAMNESGSRNQNIPLVEPSLQVVMTCRRRDLPVLEIGIDKLFEYIKVDDISVICPMRDCPAVAGALGTRVNVISEDNFIPGMTMAALKSYGGVIPPAETGWYFQQFLKLQFAYVNTEKDYYLIWDADTIPLRPLRFFDDEGKMLLTKANEFHPPYFETYKRLLSEEPNREFSLIAQHMLIKKTVAREMLGAIENTSSDGMNWAWRIMRSFRAHGDNLFSEYETYGHFLKNHYPDRVRFVERNWLRKGAVATGGWVPTNKDLRRLSQYYEYAAFERVSKSWPQHCIASLKKFVHRHSTDDSVGDH